MLETPASSGDYLLGIKGDKGTQYDAENSHSKFVLLRKNGEIKAYVMTLIADSAYLNGDKSKLSLNKFNKRDTAFSGLVIYNTPNGDFVSGWVYRNGTLLRKMSTRTPEQQALAATRKKRTQALKEHYVDDCVTYDIYETYCEWGGTTDDPYQDFHGCWDEYQGSVTVCDNSGGGSTGTEGGSTGGSGSTNPSPCQTPDPNINVSVTPGKGGLKTNFVPPPPPVDDGGFPEPDDPAPCSTTTSTKITNSIDNDCLKQSVDKAMVKGANEFASSIANSLFGPQATRNLILKESNTLKYIEDANTQGDNFELEITFNSVLANASEEFVAATSMHEILHALMALSGKTGVSEHDRMADNYVTGMVNSLKSMFPGIPDIDAKALAWGGLQLTAEWGKLVDENPDYANELLKINEDYRDKGTKGHRCAEQ